jgi:hypothetical protein
VPNGTNIFSFRVKGVNADAYHRRTQDAGVMLAAPRNDRFTLMVNETWNRAAPQAILDRLRKALG